MRIKVTYEISRIPNSYKMMIVSLIKKALNEYDENLFESLYFYKDEIKNKKSKDFVFSIFLTDFKKDNEEFIANELTLNISSPNKALMIHMYNALLGLKNYTYNNKYELKRKCIQFVKTKDINAEYSLFKTMSPIVLKNKKGYFLNIDDNEYVDTLNYIINKTLTNYRGYGLKKEIKFTPINMKKVVQKEYIKSFKEKTLKDYMYINSYKGVFALQGDIEDLNDIYLLGIGFRRNQGCGMIDVV